MNHRTAFHLSICISLFITLFSSIAFAQPSAQRTAELQQEERRQELFGQVLTLLPEHKIPAEFVSQRREVPAGRCGTMILAEAQLNLDIFTPEQRTFLAEAFVRPSLPLSYSSLSGVFKLHYTLTGRDAVAADDTDGNDVPDYVEEVAAAFDNSYDWMINKLGYLIPPDDDGVDGPEYDIYIEGLQSGFYGLTTPDGQVVSTQNQDRISYIQVDNDFMSGQFTLGIEGALVTAAHEYFHAVQFGYRTGLDSNDFWYYELCATWIEDVIYDDVNDYYSTVLPFLSRTAEPFNSFDRLSLTNYGASIWYHFLMKKYNDDRAMVRRTWEIMASQVALAEGSVMAALTQMLVDKSTNFAAEFADFAVWNFFTNTRADTVNYYEEGSEYPFVRLHGNFTITGDTTIVDSSFASSQRYYRFDVFEANGYGLAVGVDDPDEWRFAAIVTTPQGVSTVQIFKPDQSINLGQVQQFSEIMVIAINVRTFDGSELAKLRSDRSTFTFSLVPGSIGNRGDRAISSVYPSPFVLGDQDHVNLMFISSNPIDAEVRILSSTGVLLKTIKFNELPGAFQSGPEEGSWLCAWDGTDDRDEPVASGIYLFQLKQDDFVDIEKFAVIRE